MSGTIFTSNITALGGNIGGFSIDATTISSSNNFLKLDKDGIITASAGLIGGFTVSSDEIKATDDDRNTTISLDLDRLQIIL